MCTLCANVPDGYNIFLYNTYKLHKKKSIQYLMMIPPNQKKVREITLDFLEQYHDASTIESAHLVGGIWVVLAQVGQITPQMKKISIDTHSGQILSYTDITIQSGKSGIKQAQVTSAVEKALLQIGTPVYETVIQKLDEDYNCNLFECYDRPECLNQVIKEILGEKYLSVVGSIKSQLITDKEQKTMDFLAVISR